MASRESALNRFGELARQRQQVLLKPPGSLGDLEKLAIHVAQAQRTETPRARPAAALLFAADHPVARHGVSAYPQAITAAMMLAFSSGRAASCVLARSQGVPLEVIDVGVSAPYSLAASPVHAVRRETVADELAGDLSCEDAMSTDVGRMALAAGATAVDRLPADTRVVILGEMGIGNTTPAAALAAHLMGEPAEKLVGPGTGLDAAGLEMKRRIVDTALVRARNCSNADALNRLGGREIAALAGAIRRASESGRLILVDGFIVSAAALWAISEDPKLLDACVFSHRSAERGHDAILAFMDARPLLDLQLRLGEATGALTAFPIVELACALHCDMWTFDDLVACQTSADRTPK